MPVSAVFQNLEAGATVDEIAEWFDISKEQVIEVLEFAARSVAAPVPAETTPELDAPYTAAPGVARLKTVTDAPNAPMNAVEWP
jgi:hypothetical protein